MFTKCKQKQKYWSQTSNNMCSILIKCNEESVTILVQSITVRVFDLHKMTNKLQLKQIGKINMYFLYTSRCSSHILNALQKNLCGWLWKNFTSRKRKKMHLPTHCSHVMGLNILHINVMLRLLCWWRSWIITYLKQLQWNLGIRDTQGTLKNCPEFWGGLIAQVHFYVTNRPRDWISCP